MAFQPNDSLSIDDVIKPFGKDHNFGPSGSSPYLVSLFWIKQNLVFSNRRSLIFEKFCELVSTVRTAGAFPSLAMIGGSFVSKKEEPNDIDAVIFYSADQYSNFQQLGYLAREQNPFLDVRFCPEDAGTLTLVKLTSFYHMLYEGTEDRVRKGVLIVPIESQ